MMFPNIKQKKKGKGRGRRLRYRSNASKNFDFELYRWRGMIEARLCCRRVQRPQAPYEVQEG